jgi:hypothetical protein
MLPNCLKGTSIRHPNVALEQYKPPHAGAQGHLATNIGSPPEFTILDLAKDVLLLFRLACDRNRRRRVKRMVSLEPEF